MDERKKLDRKYIRNQEIAHQLVFQKKTLQKKKKTFKNALHIQVIAYQLLRH
jgi:hypothetical protein